MPIKFKTTPLHKAAGVAPPAPPLGQAVLQIKDFPQNYTTYHAHKNTAGPGKARHHNRVHISDLDPSRKWCPREPALLTMHDETRPDVFTSTAQRVTFNMGYKGADLFREMLPPDMVFGHWGCRNCTHVHSFSYTPAKCFKCGASRKCLDYKEVVLIDPVSKVSGSVDLLVDLLRNGTKTIVETKTEGGDTFKSRNKAEFEHDWRTKGYMWLADVSGIGKQHGIDLTAARVVYINKTGHDDAPHIAAWGLKDAARSSFKEYWVNRDDSFLSERLAAAKAYREWRETYDKTKGAYCSPLPARVCSGPDDTRARECAVCKKCFKPS